MSEGLRHVPVLLTSRRTQQAWRKPDQDRLEGVTDRFLLREDARGAARVDPRTQLAAQRSERRFGVESVPAGDDVGRIALEIQNPARRRHDSGVYRRSNRSTGRTNTVAPPTSTSTGYGM
jgi:hypothetical protein